MYVKLCDNSRFLGVFVKVLINHYFYELKLITIKQST